eukprot:3391860-Pleurochrysis_carterae.AAC.1
MSLPCPFARPLPASAACFPVGLPRPRLDCALRAGAQVPTMSSAPSVRPTRGPCARARGSTLRVPSCGFVPPAARTHGWAPPCATAT